MSEGEKAVQEVFGDLKDMIPINPYSRQEYSAGKVHEAIASYGDQGHLTPDQVLDACWFFDYGKSKGWQNKDWAKCLLKKSASGRGDSSYSDSQVSRFFNGKFEGNWENFMEAIHDFKEVAMERQKMTEDIFVETSVFRAINDNLTMMHSRHAPMLITGETQIGKTRSFLEYARRHPTTTKYLRCFAWSESSLKAALAEAVGVTGKHRADAVLPEIRRLLNENHLLIVDEMHEFALNSDKVARKNVELLRYVMDSAGCAVAFCGTSKLDEMLDRDPVNLGWFKQLKARCAKRVNLDDILRRDNNRDSDICLILKAYGFPHPDAETMKVLRTLSTRQLIFDLQSAIAFTTSEKGRGVKRDSRLILGIIADHQGKQEV